MGPVFVFVLFFRPNAKAGQGGETSHCAIRIVKMFHGKHFGSVGHARQVSFDGYVAAFAQSSHKYHRLCTVRGRCGLASRLA
ncbi:hypothetical protein CSC3H3_19525 [Thalassospira marina]|uniref:Secreted protein n=1 Tax=Thalassospira marina TaxID=2048283 RepID=A0ABN5FQ84_9PROT|nr:hypothetical protein CSC3H3_19525 [Thalassospira marina]